VFKVGRSPIQRETAPAGGRFVFSLTNFSATGDTDLPMKVGVRPPASGLAVLFATLAAAATGCGTRSLTANSYTSGGDAGSGGSFPIPVRDGGTYTPTRAVDILFMIDNSSGMRLQQERLLRNFPTFLSVLRTIPGGLPDLHLAVITSDMGAGDGSISGCAQTGDGGRFQRTPRPPCATSPLYTGATFIIDDGAGNRNYTGLLEDAFTCIAAVGEQGCGFEQPLAAVARALGADGSPAPAENQGFLRPDALLFIVLVSDEDDCSAPAMTTLFDTASNTTLASTLGPPLNFRCNEFGHLCSGVKPPRRAPNGSLTDIVTLDGCASAESAGLLKPLETLRAQIRSVKLFPDQQILVAAITGPSSPYQIQWRTASAPDTGPWPLMAASCAAADSSTAYPAVRLNQFAGSFGAAGQAMSICLDDFTPVLSALAAQLAARIPELP
jgi:hypothetical protein